jgi:hypothetical protein
MFGRCVAKKASRIVLGMKWMRDFLTAGADRTETTDRKMNAL